VDRHEAIESILSIVAGDNPFDEGAWPWYQLLEALDVIGVSRSEIMEAQLHRIDVRFEAERDRLHASVQAEAALTAQRKMSS
jgi:hypothetical protein